jgi:2-polyprenyl-3-methyl-5-hydroxy-6-metoxy-1,4-benzoquinol methylase
MPLPPKDPAQAARAANIDQLEPDRRAYERYRLWMIAQSPEVQQTHHLDRYRHYLYQNGLDTPAIEQQIRIVQEQGSSLEIQRWNSMLTAQHPAFNTAPNAFLVRIATTRKPGRALDVGMGQGRNAIWLAQHGWEVTGFDPAEHAVALARQIASEQGLRITAEISGIDDFDFGEHRWDLIVLSYIDSRRVIPAIQRALCPEGIVVVEAFHRDATRDRSIGSVVVYASGELPALFSDLDVLIYEEPIETADFGLEPLRLVRFCAQKPAAQA